VTIDGIEEQHNKKRILKSGGQSFKKIIENVKFAAELMTVVIRVNVDMENRSTLKELIDYLLIKEDLKGKIKLGFSPVFDFDEKKNLDYNNYCKKDVWNAESLNALKHFLTIDVIENITTASFNPSAVSCSANVYDSFIFDSDGDIYKCFLTIGKKSFSIGNVDEYLINNEVINNATHQKWIDANHAEECDECVYLPVCQSGCLYDRIKANKYHICLKSKDNIKDLLMETYNYYERESTRL